MQASKEHSSKTQRIFRVGMVAASEKETDAINRIFSATKYRTRRYIGIPVSAQAPQHAADVDLLLMFSQNPNVIAAWSTSTFVQKTQRPTIYLTRQKNPLLGKYQLSSPINPGRFMQLLDHYTISELHYFPEFEIGGDNATLDSTTLSGLRILKKQCPSPEGEPCKNILVVDDSLAVRRQMHIEFQLRNSNLDMAENAELALAHIQKKCYDMIFLDVVMPGMDGYTACKKIKKSALNVNTPVILLTSRSSSFDKIKGALAGCDAYLVKPINHNEFEAVYRKFSATQNTRGQANAS